MPATPSQIRRPVVVNHTVDFGDGVTVKFVYDRNKITDAWMNEWTALEESNSAPQLNEMLDDLIIGWDVVNDDGTAFPKTVENIGFLFALPDKALIFMELVKAAVPSRAEGNASSVPTSTQPLASTQPQQTSPNGEGGSPSPMPSASPSPT